MSDAVRKRFGATAELVAAQQDRRAAETEAELRRLLSLAGEERAAGTISTREEALDLVRRRTEALRRDG